MPREAGKPEALKGDREVVRRKFSTTSVEWRAEYDEFLTDMDKKVSKPKRSTRPAKIKSNHLGTDSDTI